MERLELVDANPTAHFQKLGVTTSRPLVIYEPASIEELAEVLTDLPQ